MSRSSVAGPRAVSPARTRSGRIALDTSRRHAVALLEHLDRSGVTRRDGNARTLGPGAGSAGS